MEDVMEENSIMDDLSVFDVDECFHSMTVNEFMSIVRINQPNNWGFNCKRGRVQGSKRTPLDTQDTGYSCMN